MRLQHVEEIAGNIRTGGRIGGKRIVKCLPRNFYEGKYAPNHVTLAKTPQFIRPS